MFKKNKLHGYNVILNKEGDHQMTLDGTTLS